MPIETQATTSSIRLQKALKAPRAKVFAALTEPKAVKKWFPEEGAGFDIEWMDMHAGGRYFFRLKDSSGEDRTLTGLVEEVEKNTSQVYTWAWDDDHYFGENRVTIRLSDKNGGTELDLTHGLVRTWAEDMELELSGGLWNSEARAVESALPA